MSTSCTIIQANVLWLSHLKNVKVRFRRSISSHIEMLFKSILNDRVSIQNIADELKAGVALRLVVPQYYIVRTDRMAAADGCWTMSRNLKDLSAQGHTCISKRKKINEGRRANDDVADWAETYRGARAVAVQCWAFWSWRRPLCLWQTDGLNGSTGVNLEGRGLGLYKHHVHWWELRSIKVNFIVKHTLYVTYRIEKNHRPLITRCKRFKKEQIVHKLN